jgi:hypothetical protein
MAFSAAFDFGGGGGGFGSDASSAHDGAPPALEVGDAHDDATGDAAGGATGSGGGEAKPVMRVARPSQPLADLSSSKYSE